MDSNIQSSVNNETQDSKVQDIRMISPPPNQDREQERRNEDRQQERNLQERNQERNKRNNYGSRGGRGNYNGAGQSSYRHQNASVPYNAGTHWFTQSTYVGGWDYPAPPPMRPYGFPAPARPLPPPPRQQRRHDHPAQNQGWRADPYVGGWDYGTFSPPIPPYVGGWDCGTPFVNQGYLPPMAYYIPPNFGQQNIYSPEQPPQSPPLPTYQGKHLHDRALYWRIVNQVNYYFG